MGSIKDWPEDERPRERLVKYGENNLSDAQLLAILINSGCRKTGENAVDLARKLIKKFNGITGIDEAHLNELTESLGIGITKASRLKAAFELGKRLISQSNSSLKKFKCSDDVARFFYPIMKNLKKENFLCLLLDGKNRIINQFKISEGSLSSSIVHPREALRPAIREAAASIIFIHNHPTGDPTPSSDDIAITKRLVESSKIVGIKVLDHIIIGDNKHFSFSSENLL